MKKKAPDSGALVLYASHRLIYSVPVSTFHVTERCYLLRITRIPHKHTRCGAVRDGFGSPPLVETRVILCLSKVLSSTNDYLYMNDQKYEKSKKVPAPTIAAPGIVRNHPLTIDIAKSQWTLRGLRMAPTPLIAPVITCVVDTGIPRALALKSEIEPARVAALHQIGVSLVILLPIVRMIRIPPKSVPMPIAV